MFEARIIKIYPGANPYSKTPSILAQLSSTIANKQEHSTKRYSTLIQQIKQIQPSHTREWENELPALSTPQHGIGLEECIAYLAVLFQRWMGYPASEYSSQATRVQFDHESVYIVIEYCQIKPAVAALTTAINILAIWEQQAEKVQQLVEMEFYQNFIEQYVSKPAGQIKFIREAKKRNIPWRNLGENDEYLELGHGKKCQRIYKHFSRNTSYIATNLSTNKSLANHLLRSRGLPVPKQFVVNNEQQAREAFHKLGTPLVVKPLATDYGTAVHPGLMTINETLEAFHIARPYGSVLMESHIPGEHHRIMIIHGELTSARKQVAAHVIGNGADTVRQLVDAANILRNKNGWAPIPFDEEAQILLKRQQLSLESVPSPKQRINLRLQGNLSTGGTMEVVTDIIHPDNILMAKRAAEILDIDIAGIDFITTDISRPYYENGGQICEINVTPGFIFNEEKILFDHWFPNQDKGRIPVVVFLDARFDGNMQNDIMSTLKKHHPRGSCLVNESGVFLDNNRLCDKTLPINKRIQLALAEPEVSIVAIMLHSNELLERGTCLEYIDALFIHGQSASDLEQTEDRHSAIKLLSALSHPRHQFVSAKLLATMQNDSRLQALDDSDEHAATLETLTSLLNTDFTFPG